MLLENYLIILRHLVNLRGTFTPSIDDIYGVDLR